jgi:hypothetical protein
LSVHWNYLLKLFSTKGKMNDIVNLMWFYNGNWYLTRLYFKMSNIYKAIVITRVLNVVGLVWFRGGRRRPLQTSRCSRS